MKLFKKSVSRKSTTISALHLNDSSRAHLKVKCSTTHDTELNRNSKQCLKGVARQLLLRGAQHAKAFSRRVRPGELRRIADFVISEVGAAAER